VGDPTLEEYDAHTVESKLLEVDELTNGDVFAEYASILKEAIKFTVVTAIPTECYIIDRKDFMKLGKEAAEHFLHYSKMMPSDADLRRALIESYRWEFFKNGITMSVKADQLNRKQNFDKQLRQPAQLPMKMKDRSVKDSSGKDGFTDKFLSKNLTNGDMEESLKPNFLSTYDFLIKSKKAKNDELTEK
jgi:hypothetical protein